MSRSPRKIEAAAVAAMVLGLSSFGVITAVAASESAPAAAPTADVRPDNWIPAAQGSSAVVSPANWIPAVASSGNAGTVAAPDNWIP